MKIADAMDPELTAVVRSVVTLLKRAVEVV